MVDPILLFGIFRGDSFSPSPKDTYRILKVVIEGLSQPRSALQEWTNALSLDKTFAASCKTLQWKPVVHHSHLTEIPYVITTTQLRSPDGSGIFH